MHRVEGHSFRASQLPEGVVAVMFVADWCGYCTRFMPHFSRVRKGWVVDISDETEPAWDDHSIEVVPTVILFEDGVEKRRWAGVLKEPHASEIAAALPSP